MAAVAIEPLAKRVGATKGSAYWHFANREALLAATLERWESEYTEAVIRLIEGEDDVEDRLRLLFRTALGRESDVRLELALLAATDQPMVAAAVQRVSERRIDYLAAMFTSLGFAPDQAHRRAVLAYSVYLGQAQLRRNSIVARPSAEGYEALLDDMLSGLLVR